MIYYQYEDQLRRMMDDVFKAGGKPKKIVIYTRGFEYEGIPVEFVPYKRGDVEFSIIFDDEVEE